MYKCLFNTSLQNKKSIIYLSLESTFILVKNLLYDFNFTKNLKYFCGNFWAVSMIYLKHGPQGTWNTFDEMLLHPVVIRMPGNFPQNFYTPDTRFTFQVRKVMGGEEVVVVACRIIVSATVLVPFSFLRTTLPAW